MCLDHQCCEWAEKNLQFQDSSHKSSKFGNFLFQRFFIDLNKFTI